MSMISSVKSLFKMYQGKFEDLVDFRKRFMAVAEVLDYIDADIGKFAKGITNKIIKKDYNVERKIAMSMQVETVEKTAKNSVLAGLFLEAADPNRYRVVLEGLENQYLKGENQYPTDVTAAFNMLQNWKSKSKATDNAPYNDGINFAQGAEHSSDQNDDNSTDRCYRCGKPGPYAKNCPKGKRGAATGSANAMMDAQDSGDEEETLNVMANAVDGKETVEEEDHDEYEAYECAMCTGNAGTDDTPAAVGGNYDEFDAYECAFCTGDAVTGKDAAGSGTQ